MKKLLLILISALLVCSFATTSLSWAAVSGPGTGTSTTDDTEPPPPPPPPK